jgi:hypothetical protein
MGHDPRNEPTTGGEEDEVTNMIKGMISKLYTQPDAMAKEKPSKSKRLFYDCSSIGKRTWCLQFV